ncbi:cyclin-G1-like [Syngnathoides biaculeatus]|uniref:cyclin-G1-like n=1 Tax=Syngnathoides biaculeatus TaxID=300417 RepID=UPI002ADD4034|nr:cyclin-G1-like [Syngnathoides biaculeatus]XP_061672278.1 cyclin-G1-like [Syngnathoides biaculeatus]XP_061672279.1 cyclin-G1-like [Syngnathoides biaculeatus]
MFSRMRDHRGLDKALVKELNACCAQESKFLPNKSGLKMMESSQSGVSAKCRDARVEELWGLTNFFGYSTQTFVRAVNLMDRFLAGTKAKPEHVPCVSVCCLHLAAGVTEEAKDVAPVCELIRISHSNFAMSDLRRMKTLVVQKLGPETPAVTAFTFLRLYYSALSAVCDDVRTEIPSVMTLEAQLKACLCRLVFSKAKPSLLALALVAYEIESLQCAAASKMMQQMQKATKVCDGDLRHWQYMVGKRMTEYRSAQCHKPNGRKLVWAVSKWTVQSTHGTLCTAPRLPTIHEDAWDHSLSEVDTNSGEDSPCGSLGSVGEGSFFPSSYL